MCLRGDLVRKKEVNTFDYGCKVCKAKSTRAISLHILLGKGKLEIAQLNCILGALVQNNTTKPRELDLTFQQYVQGSPDIAEVEANKPMCVTFLSPSVTETLVENIGFCKNQVQFLCSNFRI